MPILSFVEALRPKQWIKNLFLLAPLVFTPERWSGPTNLKALIAFASFSAVASAIYIWNDWWDLENDRAHPEKCKRPLASGRLQPAPALVGAALLAIAGLAGMATTSKGAVAVLAVYTILQLLYSVRLKHLVILDVMTIAAGFVLRVLAGGFAVGIHLSSWFLVTTSLLALFLGFTKRRQEIDQLAEDSSEHRTVLEDYNIAFIDQMNSVLAGSCIVCYALFTVAPETVQKFGTEGLIATLPFVVYGLLRYLHLIHLRDLGDNPTEVALRDRPLQLCVFLWLATFLLIVRLKP